MTATVTTKVTGGVAGLAAAGELDLHTAQRLRSAVEAALRPGVDRVVVDLNAVAFYDSSGVQALVDGCRLAAERGAVLRVTNASQGTLDPGVILVEKPFSEPDLLHRVREVLDATDSS